VKNLDLKIEELSILQLVKRTPIAGCKTPDMADAEIGVMHEFPAFHIMIGRRQFVVSFEDLIRSILEADKAEPEEEEEADDGGQVIDIVGG
jgi:hypothetical protein